MDSEVSLKPFEILSIFFHLLTVILVSVQFINTHKGDCRGKLVSTKQNPDGYCVTREAKLSMHEMSPEELKSLRVK